MKARSSACLALPWTAVLLALLVPADALAQTGTTRFVVGTAAGGAIDPYARIIADHMAKTLRQTIIIEHKPGANGNMSAAFVAEAAADGTLVWISTQAFTEINPSAFRNQRWSIDDFMPLIRGVEAPLVLVAHPGIPAASFGEFITWAQANRGKLAYSSYNPGTPSHFLGHQLNDKFGLDLTHVPYRGSGLQVTGLVGGHSLFGFAQVNSSMEQVRAAKLKALAITSAAQFRSMPDVPTFVELGHPEFTAQNLVRAHGQDRHAFQHRPASHGRSKGRTLGPGGQGEAGGARLRCGGRDRPTTQDQHQGTDRALGTPGEGRRVQRRRSRARRVEHEPEVDTGLASRVKQAAH